MFHPEGPTLRELAVQALSSVPRGYDLLAPKFDVTPFRTPDAVLGPALADLAPPGGLERALDVCCGTGAAMRFLRPLCRAQVVGADVSEGMMAEARRRLADAPGRAELAFVRADARALPFEGTFALATCFGALGHIPERDEPAFAASVARALAPGGRFVTVTSDPVSPLRPGWWVARGFNAAMRVRNAVWKPEFVMYYLTFLVPRATQVLEGAGLRVRVDRGLFPAPYGRLVRVVATKPG